MSTFLEEQVTPVATFLGYMFLACWVVVLLWFFAALLRELIYDHRSKRAEEREWDNLRSQWLLHQRADQQYHLNHHTDTDILDLSAETLYDWSNDSVFSQHA